MTSTFMGVYNIPYPFPARRCFSTIFENIVAKGECAHIEQFSRFANMFSTLFNHNTSYLEMFA